MSQHLANISRRVRREAAERQRKEAFRLAMLSVRGRYDPPKSVLDRLSRGDRAEYEAARQEAGMR